MHLQYKAFSVCFYLNMGVICWYRHKLGQAFAEPHGNISLHVDSKGLETFLQATDCEVTQAAHILPEVYTAHLGKSQTAYRDEAWSGEQPYY